MSAVAVLLGRLSSAIDDVAKGLAGVGAALRRRRRVELVEQPDGRFRSVGPSTAQLVDEPPLGLDQNGLAKPLLALTRSLLPRSAVDIVLAPSRFVFRQLELPRGADPFLEGVIRSQIDRLTPWRPDEAAFGWGEPVERGLNRISVVIAATALTLVAPIVSAMLAGGAHSVQISTRAEAQEGAIPVFYQRATRDNGRDRLRRGLAVGLVVSSLAFALSLGAWFVVGDAYAGRLAELQKNTAERRATLLGQRNLGSAGTVLALEARKRTTPSAVMTIEALSDTLPDDAYLTELAIDNDKLQIAGAASNAASLIRLIEQSRRFTRATFYAPTVRRAEGGETFHIEGHIEPSFPATN